MWSNSGGERQILSSFTRITGFFKKKKKEKNIKQAAMNTENFTNGCKRERWVRVSGWNEWRRSITVNEEMITMTNYDNHL